MNQAVEALKALREQAWTPTKHGELFALHFDDTLYLQLVAQWILNEAQAYTSNHPGILELKARYGINS